MDKILLFDLVSSDKKTTSVYFDIQDLYNEHYSEFSIEKLQEYSATYHPEKITYTGVTVGGVHTGGFTKEDAHFTTQTRNSGYARLRYKEFSATSDIIIDEIIFPEYMQEIALREISIPFSNANKTGYQLYNARVKASQSEVMYALSSGDAYAQSRIVNGQLQNNSTIEVCSKIGDFLTRALRGDHLTPKQKCKVADILLADTNPLACVIASNFLRSAKTPEEQAKAKIATEKMKNTKLYDLGDKIYRDKENYKKAIIRSIVNILRILALAATILLCFKACTQGVDTTGDWIAILLALPVHIILCMIAAKNEPDKDSYTTSAHVPR